jgi:hypothetical protein
MGFFSPGLQIKKGPIITLHTRSADQVKKIHESISSQLAASNNKKLLRLQTGGQLNGDDHES